MGSPRKQLHGSVTALIAGAALLVSCAGASAGLIQHTWTRGAGTTAWGTGANWSTGLVPNAPTDDALFMGAGPGDVDINGGSYTVDILQFGAGGYTLLDSSVAPGSLTFNTLNHTSGTNTISLLLSSAGLASAISGGDLTLANVGNTIAGGTWTVTGGATLRALASGTGSGLGSANVSLNGSTLDIGGQATENAGLAGTYYDEPVRDTSQFPRGGGYGNALQEFNTYAEITNLINRIGAPDASQQLDGSYDTAGIGAIDFPQGGGANSTGGNPFSNIGVNVGNDDMLAFWQGTLRVGAGDAGLTSFRTASDDGSMIFIDGNVVVNNNNFQGVTSRTGAYNLTAGDHEILVAFYEGDGGAGVAAYWTPLSTGTETLIMGTDARFLTKVADNASLTNTVTAINNSTIRLSTNSTLDLPAINVTGNVTIDVASGGTLIPAVYNDTDTPSTLTKTGLGTLKLDNSGGGNNTGDTLFNIQQGTVYALGANPLGTDVAGTTNVVLDGGTLKVEGALTATPGLLGTHEAGNMYMGANTGNLGIVLGPLGGRSSAEHWDDVIGHDNSTLVYTGQIYLGGATTFVESIDDSTLLTVGGATVLNNTSWNNTTHGTYTPASAGWYDFELRFSNGGGGYGPVQQDGWTATFGFGFDVLGRDDEDETHHVFPLDPGDGSLFRVAAIAGLNMQSTDITVLADSTLNAITDTTADFGHLTFNPAGGQALLTTESAKQGITFLDTTVASGGTLGFVTETPTWAGQIAGGGFGATIVKDGSSDLILDQGGMGLLGSTFDVRAGRMLTEGLAPLGGGGGSGGSIGLSGGEWGLTSTGGNINVTNALDVTADSTLSAGLYPELPAGVAGPVTITLSDLALTGGILTLDGNDGYAFDIPGTRGDGSDIMSNGGLYITSGTTLTTYGQFSLRWLDIEGTVNMPLPPVVDVQGATHGGDSYLRIRGTQDFDFTGGSLLTDFQTDLEIYGPRTVTVPYTNLDLDQLILRYGGNLVMPAGSQVTADNQYLFEFDSDYTLQFDLVGDANIELRGDDGDRAFYAGDHLQTPSNRILYLHRGALVLDDPSLLPPGRLEFHADSAGESTVLMTTGTFDRTLGTGAGQVRWGDNEGGGFAALGGPLTVNIRGDGSTVSWGTSEDGFRGRRLMFGHALADSQVELVNGIDLGDSDREVRVWENPNLPGEDTVTIFSGQLTGPSSGNDNWLRIRGDGTLWLTNTANTFQQRIILYDGVTLRVGQDAIGLGTANRLRFEGPDAVGTVLEGYGQFNWNIGDETGGVYWQEDGGFSAHGGYFTVTLEGGADLQWNSSTVGFRDRRLHFGSRTADNVVELTNNITETSGGDRRVYVFDNPDSPDDYALLSGTIAVRDFFKQGDGLLEISNTLTTGEEIWVDEGTLRLTGVAQTSNNRDIYVRNGATLAVAAGGHADSDDEVRVESGSLLGGSGLVEADGQILLNTGTRIGPGMPYNDEDVLIVGGFVIPPPDSVGTLTAQPGTTLRMSTGSIYEWDLALGEQDLVEVLGSLQLDADWILQVTGLGGSASAADEFVLFTYTGSATVAMAGAEVDAVLDFSQMDPEFYAYWDASNAHIYHRVLSEGGEIYLTGLEALAIPEPATLTLLAAGFAALAIRRKRRA